MSIHNERHPRVVSIMIKMSLNLDQYNNHRFLKELLLYHYIINEKRITRSAEIITNTHIIDSCMYKLVFSMFFCIYTCLFLTGRLRRGDIVIFLKCVIKHVVKSG